MAKSIQRGNEAIARSKSGVRHGPHSKNVNSTRRPKSSNAGTRTGPIKGRDRGTG